MDYVKLIIGINETEQERLVAELAALGYEAFQQTDDSLITYAKGHFTGKARERFFDVLEGFHAEAHLKSEEIIHDQNWNANWEKSINPQSIGRFLVRPTWSEQTPESDQILLEIDPQMAFGTGYHETTRLMLRLLPEVVRSGHRVLDAGTGSGILAMAAIKLGASGVLAFDKDPRSVQNARKNSALNGVGNQIEIKEGTHNVVSKTATYDVILANIQRNVIIEMLPAFVESLKPGGYLLLSGLLKSEKSLMKSRLSEHGLIINDTTQENKWMAIKAAL